MRMGPRSPCGGDFRTGNGGGEGFVERRTRDTRRSRPCELLPPRRNGRWRTVGARSCDGAKTVEWAHGFEAEGFGGARERVWPTGAGRTAPGAFDIASGACAAGENTFGCSPCEQGTGVRAILVRSRDGFATFVSSVFPAGLIRPPRWPAAPCRLVRRGTDPGRKPHAWRAVGKPDHGPGTESSHPGPRLTRPGEPYPDHRGPGPDHGEPRPIAERQAPIHA